MIPEKEKRDPPSNLQEALAFIPLVSLTDNLDVLSLLPPYQVDIPPFSFNPDLEPYAESIRTLNNLSPAEISEAILPVENALNNVKLSKINVRDRVTVKHIPTADPSKATFPDISPMSKMITDKMSTQIHETMPTSERDGRSEKLMGIWKFESWLFPLLNQPEKLNVSEASKETTVSTATCNSFQTEGVSTSGLVAKDVLMPSKDQGPNMTDIPSAKKSEEYLQRKKDQITRTTSLKKQRLSPKKKVTYDQIAITRIHIYIRQVIECSSYPNEHETFPQILKEMMPLIKDLGEEGLASAIRHSFSHEEQNQNTGNTTFNDLLLFSELLHNFIVSNESCSLKSSIEALQDCSISGNVDLNSYGDTVICTLNCCCIILAVMIACNMHIPSEDSYMYSAKITKRTTISTICRFIKHQVVEEFVPYLENVEENGDVNSNSRNKSIDSFIAIIASRTGDILISLLSLMKLISFGESELISIAYTCIPLFYIPKHDAIKLSGLKLLQEIYAKYPDQSNKNWILEDILSLQIKFQCRNKSTMQYRLVDGKFIYIFSAVIMQLIQGLSKPLFRGMSDQDIAIILEEVKEMGMESPQLNKIENSSRHFFEESQEDIKFIFKYILSRCLKKEKNPSTFTNDCKYKILLDVFIHDLFTVLNHPEWPVAELFLQILSKYMIAYCDEKGNDIGGRLISLDYLGQAGARIKENAFNVKEVQQIKSLPSQEDFKDEHFQNLFEFQHILLSFVSKSFIDKSLIKSSLSFHSTQQIFYLKNLLPHSNDFSENWRNYLCGTVDLLLTFGIHNDTQRFMDSCESPKRTDVIAIQSYLSTSRPFFSSFDVILSKILNLMDFAVISVRVKAMRALQQIATVDPSILGHDIVKNAVEERLQDVSSSVRDTVIDLISKYVTYHPPILVKYYDAIAKRLMDTSIGVRKRVLRFLKTIYQNQDTQQQMKTDILSKILFRLNDEDTSLRDLASKAFSELLYSSTGEGPDFIIKCSEKSTQWNDLPVKVRKSILSQALCLGHLLQCHGELFDCFSRKCVKSNERSTFKTFCDYIIFSLMDQLLVIDEAKEENFLENVMIILYHIAKASPEMVSSHAFTLNRYIKLTESAPQKQKILFYYISILTSTLPFIKYMDPAVLKNMQTDLLKSTASVSPQVLPVVISCLHTIVEKTGLFGQVKRLFQMCIERLQKYSHDVVKPSEKFTLRTILITGLLCKHHKLYSKEEDNCIELFNEALSLLVSFAMPNYCDKIRLNSIQSIGYAFIAQPLAMLQEKIQNLFSDIFSGNNLELKMQLLKIFIDYLDEEKLKMDNIGERTKEKTNLDFGIFSGVSDQLRDESIGGSIIQSYLDSILKSCLCDKIMLQKQALDVIKRISVQGLAHPFKCIPMLVAVETSEDAALSKEAQSIHEFLSEKYPSLVHTKFRECIETAYNYQVLVGSVYDLDQGFTDCESKLPNAKLQCLYNILQPLKMKRREFLSQLVRLFDIDLKNLDSSKIKVDFSIYISNNIAYLHYKTEDDILLILNEMEKVLSVSGEYLYHIKPEDKLDSELRINALDSLNMSILLILFRFLTNVYGISSIRSDSEDILVKSKAAEKPVSIQSKYARILNWKKILPYSYKGMNSRLDYIDQLNKFSKLFSTSIFDIENSRS